jgi:WS/DGAT/MGAT family acyltransferase
MADGMALTRVALSLADPAPDAVAPVPPAAPAAGGSDGSDGSADRHGLGALAGGALGLARTTVAAAPVLTRLTLAPRPVGPLAAAPHHTKRAVWADPVPLETVTRIGRRTGSTVTDVALAALTGALRTWLLARGADTTDVATMVPVDVRRPGAPLPPELGNRFALVLLDLPVGESTPRDRLDVVRERMAAVKHSPEAQVTYALLQTMGLTVPRLRRHLTGFFAGKAVGVTTSVHGPDEPLWLAGRQVTRMLGWAPVSGDQTLSTCILGYDHHLDVGFKVDLAAVPDPETLVTAFAAEITALAQATPDS